MKKGKIRKLRLGKLTIASLDRENLFNAQAGKIDDGETALPFLDCADTSPLLCTQPSIMFGCTNHSRPPQCQGG